VARRTYEEQSTHDSLVRMMLNYYATQGYLNICADLENCSRPAKFYWQGRPNYAFIPDLTCQKNDPKGTQIILEAETCESLGEDHTREQFQLFSANALQHGKEFHVAVPRLCSVGGNVVTSQSLIRRFATTWNVTVHKIWWPSE
jgi:hypothetical protein